MPDGSDVIRLSWHDTNEWHRASATTADPLYALGLCGSRLDVAHHLWTCFPDGRDPRAPHGNYPVRREFRPWMEMSLRAIPNSNRCVATAAPHHGEAYGSLVLLDVRSADDRAGAQVRRLTPEVPFPESESAPGVPHPKGKHSPRAEVYGTPWPLSEDYFLCVHDAGQRNYGIYLIDSFGNRELLYRDPAISCLDPIPLRPRRRPPIIPVATTQAVADRKPNTTPADLAMGTVAVMNVRAMGRGRRTSDKEPASLTSFQKTLQTICSTWGALRSSGAGPRHRRSRPTAVRISNARNRRSILIADERGVAVHYARRYIRPPGRDADLRGLPRRRPHPHHRDKTPAHRDAPRAIEDPPEVAGFIR